jgi:hypothetical protein
MGSKGGGSVNIPSNYTHNIGGTGHPIQVDADLDNIHVKELPRIEYSVKELPRIEVGVKELPRIEVQATTSSDVRSTLDVAIKEIPDTRVHLPAHYNLGISLFGIEILSFSLCGESQVINEKYVPRRVELCV